MPDISPGFSRALKRTNLEHRAMLVRRPIDLTRPSAQPALGCFGGLAADPVAHGELQSRSWDVGPRTPPGVRLCVCPDQKSPLPGGSRRQSAVPSGRAEKALRHAYHLSVFRFPQGMCHGPPSRVRTSWLRSMVPRTIPSAGSAAGRSPCGFWAVRSKGKARGEPSPTCLPPCRGP